MDIKKQEILKTIFSSEIEELDLFDMTTCRIYNKLLGDDLEFSFLILDKNKDKIESLGLVEGDDDYDSSLMTLRDQIIASPLNLWLLREIESALDIHDADNREWEEYRRSVYDAYNYSRGLIH